MYEKNNDHACIKQLLSINGGSEILLITMCMHKPFSESDVDCGHYDHISELNWATACSQTLKLDCMCSPYF